MKRAIIIGAAAVCITAVAGTGIFFGVRTLQINKLKEEKLNLPPDFTVTAHTGCMETEENSIESMEKGIANGAKTVEFDVRFDNSGTPVLSHDEPAGGEVTLDEAFKFLSEHAEIKANVDLKSTENLAEVQNLAEKNGVIDRIFFTGVNESFVSAVKKDCPEIKYYLNMNVDKKKADDREYILSLVSEVKNQGAIGINFDKGSATKLLCDVFRENGLLVSIWTVNKEAEMHKILNFAPDNITTKEPKRLAEIIEERN